MNAHVKRQRSVATLVAATMFGLVSSGAYATAVIGNFEGGSLDGWVPAPFQSYTAGLTPVQGIGNTLGQWSLAVDNNPNDFWGPAKDIVATGNAPDLLANQYLTADITFRGLSGDVTGYAQVTQMALNDGTGFFQQQPPISSPNNWDGPGSDVTRTFVWDLDQFTVSGVPYRQWLASNPTPSHITFWLVSQSGGGPFGPNQNQGRIYFDNIQLVPEPASMVGLIGAGALLAARRRRA